ncbi:zinc ABC transporter substrate-binding protein [Kiritimatiellota bacterium B12222]|nr:zinc ABC transporter substrate-binding protein [Kiritimatiellota bacterium B12222]
MKILLKLLLCGLISGSVFAHEAQLNVAATVGMIGDVVKNVAGDRANVVTIMGTDVDPHLYRPTRNDVMKLQQADIIFYNGMMLEGKMGDVLVRMSRRGKAVYPVTEDLQEVSDYVLNTEEDHLDPHVWMDVQGWMAAVNVVEAGLCEQDPEHADEFKANAQAYREQLAVLDAYAEASLATVPQKQRVLVTAHDAFSYMGRAYGLQVKGIQGISTESEAGVKDIENLITFLVANDIPAVFVETSVADKNIRALVEGAQAQNHPVIIGGSLFSDAMGKPGTYEGTYIGMIDHNVTVITRALGGVAPEQGMQGKLATPQGK